MSQASQFSEVYLSSIYEGDPIDNLQFCFPNASESRQTLNSIPDSDFLRPPSPPLIPDTLTRVGPDRAKSFVLYSDMTKDAFVTWWLRTDYGNKKRCHWDGRHQADCWQSFEQVADARTGKPGVMCKSCNKILDHPANGHFGTSSMNKHIKGVNCRRAATRRPNIKQILEHAVCLTSTT
jgi:hypothetical protein